MTMLDFWAADWQVPAAAVADLRRRFCAYNDGLPAGDSGDKSEGAIQNLVRVEASRAGGRLWRNNVGGTYTDDGRFLRYGLANETATINKNFKSSDLIGLRPVRIMQAHVGGVMGQFLAREIKPGNWRFTGAPRERAQLNFLKLVGALGGDAAFANSEGTIYENTN